MGHSRKIIFTTGKQTHKSAVLWHNTLLSIVKSIFIFVVFDLFYYIYNKQIKE